MLSAEDWQAVALSLQVAMAAVIVSFPLGLGLAWLLARKRFPGKFAVETIVALPLVLPPVVTGYLLLVLFGGNGWIGHWLRRWLGVEIIFTWKAAALASAVMAFPLMVRSIRSAIEMVDPRLEQAARTLGAGPLDAFFTITLPLARRGVVAGCVLAFARSIGEFGATIMIAGNIPGDTRTIPLAIYSELDSPGGAERSTGLVVASIAIAVLAMVVSEALNRGRDSRKIAANRSSNA